MWSRKRIARRRTTAYGGLHWENIIGAITIAVAFWANIPALHWWH